MKYFNVFSVGLLLALSLNMLIIFFIALFSEAKVCHVSISWYGEAWVEAILFPVIFIAGVVTLIRLLREVKK